MKIEEKIVRLSKDDVIVLEEIVLDKDKEGAYNFAKKIKGNIEAQENKQCRPYT